MSFIIYKTFNAFIIYKTFNVIYIFYHSLTVKRNKKKTLNWVITRELN